ncbi:hypothetical protein NPIL_508701 [Nephila pilipes]|uniref:Uncharacterized protein n=1 Tax=Nephila pilipes TaxID=299642 RepID=A0A8X6R173_NEPPI|nr:hypothetical protein NPIL_508701 [Nephila pilipes]
MFKLYGLMKNKENIFLEASQDSLIVCDCCEMARVEIICPARGAANPQPRYQKLCTPSNRCLRMWRTSANRSAMDGLCSGDPPS